ncbi:multidrug resistance-associated protein 4-like isoform X2 [Varroa destructor]|nr:multidrug resistance-associated protein 4-like isoform X2 [Varroa destructor]
MVNLMSNDVRYLDTSLLFVPYILVAPLQTVLITIVLYREIGWPSICCLGYMLVWVPMQLVIGRKFARIRLQTAEITDRRVRFTNELVAAIRAIKMYAWEKPFGLLVSDIRRMEIGRVRIASALKGINMALFFVSSKFILFLCCILYTMVAGKSLTSEKVFVTIALLNSVRLAMGLYFPYGMGQGLETLVSLRRIQRFLMLEEKGQSAEPLSRRGSSRSTDDAMLRLADVRASWISTILPSDTNLLALNNVNFRVRRGELVIVTGPVGCGKSSLLMAILGELPLLTGTIKLGGTIAYASQVPWLFNATLKRNICFNSAADEIRFRKVVKICALEKDIELLPHAEETLVEDKGTSLSGGQKARVSLARAVYHDADLYLLDDPLSAVDANVSRHIFASCIQKYLLHRGKAVILATHQLQYLRHADRVLLLRKNGKPVAYGNYYDIIHKGIDIEGILNTDQNDESDNLKDYNVIEKSEREPFDVAEPSKDVPADSKTFVRLDNRNLSQRETFEKSKSQDGIEPNVIINGDVEAQGAAAMRAQQTEESKTTGTVSAAVYWKYVTLGTGWLSFSFLGLSSLASQALFNGVDFWLSYWCDKVKDAQENGETNLDLHYLSWLAWMYGGLIVLLVAASVIRALLFFAMCMRSSVRLHDDMFACIMRAPISFFERNPIGRIQNRFTKDLGVIDDILPPTGLDISFITLNLVGVLTSVAIICPYIIIPTLVLLVLFSFLWNIYIRTARDIKRLEGVTRSPMFSHVSSTLQGLATIRAYRVEPVFKHLFDLYQDRHTSSWNLFLCTTRWFGITLDFLAFTYIAIVTMSLAILGANGVGGLTGSQVGLAVTNALLLTGMFQWGVRQAAEIESHMTSVERVLEYCSLVPEAPSETKPECRPPKGWPNAGALTLRNVNLRYLQDQPPVLCNLSCHFQPGEKIGIIGRTGAGKSSIIAALFRLYEPEGDIIIDGVSTSTLGLHELRSAIGIIPQEPSLFAGSLRRNIDPFGEISDEELWQALDAACLKKAVEDMSGGLNATISEEGANLSSGQRQLVCLARAIVRRCKILVLDEATANVDPHTDECIQNAIRRSFHHATVLTVAHRLHTVMDSNRVMVLDAGRIVEFAEPHSLLQDPRSGLSQLVDRTGPATAEKLRRLAKEAHLSKRTKNVYRLDKEHVENHSLSYTSDYNSNQEIQWRESSRI